MKENLDVEVLDDENDEGLNMMDGIYQRHQENLEMPLDVHRNMYVQGQRLQT